MIFIEFFSEKQVELFVIDMEQFIESPLTAVESSQEDLDLPPPSYSPPPYSLPLYSPPPYSPAFPYPRVQIGKECILSVDGGIITVVGGRVRIKPWEENDLSQKWKIESAYSRFGFRNQLSGKVLGVHKFNGNVVAGNKKLKHWELFYLHAITGGFVFRIPAYLMWIEVALVHPYLTDYLQASGRRNWTSIVYIHYTNH